MVHAACHLYNTWWKKLSKRYISEYILAHYNKAFSINLSIFLILIVDHTSHCTIINPIYIFNVFNIIKGMFYLRNIMCATLARALLFHSSWYYYHLRFVVHFIIYISTFYGCIIHRDQIGTYIQIGGITVFVPNEHLNKLLQHIIIVNSVSARLIAEVICAAWAYAVIALYERCSVVLLRFMYSINFYFYIYHRA